MTTTPTGHFDTKAARVGGGGLTAEILPWRGAKIVSLTDGSGYEWLLPPQRPLVRPARLGTAFIDAEMCGWDECAPTIVACEAGGHEIPDHGDLWDVEWTVDGDSMTGRGRSLSYALTRTIVAIERGLRFDYKVTAAGDDELPLLWAAHPQFTAPAGSRVLTNASTVVDVLHRRNTKYEWTPELSTIDTVPVRGCRKVFADPDNTPDEATLEVPGRGRLRLRWDRASTPYLGIWFDNLAYARQPVIALEPTTGYYDSLSDAIDNRRVLTIEPGRSTTWFLEVTVQ